MQKCTLALGCFWKPEENFKNKLGILHTEVGYAGGDNSKTTYEEVCTGSTGHAEVVRLTFKVFLRFPKTAKSKCTFLHKLFIYNEIERIVNC